MKRYNNNNNNNNKKLVIDWPAIPTARGFGGRFGILFECFLFKKKQYRWELVLLN
jgi:hypothetical protein